MLIEVIRNTPVPPRSRPVMLGATLGNLVVEGDFSVQPDGSVYGGVLGVRFKPEEGSLQRSWHFACSPDAIPSILPPEVVEWLSQFVVEAKAYALLHLAH